MSEFSAGSTGSTGAGSTGDGAARPDWEEALPAGEPSEASPRAGRHFADEPPVEEPMEEVVEPLPPEPPDEVARIAAERDEYLDALRRMQAEFDNYRKRVARQQLEQIERAAEALVTALLPVLDTADLALAHGGGEEVKQVWSALNEALQRAGLERIDPAGQPFDPNLHEAVSHEPGEGEQAVSQVLRPGFSWKGRVLRPAMVTVRG